MTLPSDNQIQILLVEDEAVLALDLCDTLEADGYRVVGTARSGPRALALFEQHHVDLVICDIHIQGEWDGIETALRLQARRPVPLIYLTAHADEETLGRALRTAPAAYLTKPATMTSLRAAIILALQRFAEPELPATPTSASRPADRDLLTRDTILQLGDHVFVKDNYQFVRIPLRDIQILEADNTYTTLITAARKYALRLSLGAVLERLQFPALVRVHRSFALNIEQVEAFSEAEALVAGQPVPLGRHYKENFLQQFQPR